MAVYFNDSGWTRLYKTFTGHGITGHVECTIAAWARAKDITTQHPILNIVQESNYSLRYAIHLRGDENDKAKAAENTSGISSASTYAANTWVHIVGAFEAGTNGGRSIFLNGAKTRTSQTVASPSPDYMLVGFSNAGFAHSAHADIAEVSVWSRLLTDAEIGLLAAGKSAACFPQSLEAYHKLIDDYTCEVGSGNLNPYNTPQFIGEHPTINYGCDKYGPKIQTV